MRAGVSVSVTCVSHVCVNNLLVFNQDKAKAKTISKDQNQMEKIWRALCSVALAKFVAYRKKMNDPEGGSCVCFTLCMFCIVCFV